MDRYFKKNFPELPAVKISVKKLSQIFLFFAWALVLPVSAQPRIDGATRQVDRPLRQEIEKELRKIPAKEPIIEEKDFPPAEDSPHFFIENIALEGVESFDSEDFAFIIQKYENRKLSLESLNELAKKIEQEYLRRGIIAAVFVPEQEIKENTVYLQVVEAKMGDLIIQDHAHFKRERLKYYWNIPPGDIVRYRKIKKSLTLMNKNPGREVKATLTAGKEPGTTDIFLGAETFFPLHFQPAFDREGIAATGKEKKLLGVRHNNLLGFDDIFLGGYTFTKDSTGIYAYHNIPITNFGTSLFYGYSRSKSTPGKELAFLDIDSKADNFSFFVSQDIFRDGEYKGDVSLGIDVKDKVTRLITGLYRKDKLRILRLRGNYRWKGFGGAGIFSPEISQGIDAFGAKMDDLFASRGANATFTKFNFSGQHLRGIDFIPFDSYGSLTLKGQLSSDKLAPQEQFVLGGMDSVRGYPPSDYLADNAVAISYELVTDNFLVPRQWKLPYFRKSVRDQTNLVFFVDAGYGQLRGASPDEKSSRTLIGAGAGLRINPIDHVDFRLEWGVPLGDGPLTESSNSRFHFSFSFDFHERTLEELEYIKDEKREKRIKRWAWDIVNAELAIVDSSVRQKLSNYFHLAEAAKREGELSEAKRFYEKISKIGKILYRQAEEYVRRCLLQQEKLQNRHQLALEHYRGGELEQAKRLWLKNIEEAKIEPLFFQL